MGEGADDYILVMYILGDSFFVEFVDCTCCCPGFSKYFGLHPQSKSIHSRMVGLSKSFPRR